MRYRRANECSSRHFKTKSKACEVLYDLFELLAESLGGNSSVADNLRGRAEAAHFMLRWAKANAAGLKPPSRNPMIDDYLRQAVELNIRHTGNAKAAPRRTAKMIFDLQKTEKLYCGPTVAAIEMRIKRLLKRRPL